MKRPDLKKGDIYDGWQVLDPTPQELSEGEHNFVVNKEEMQTDSNEFSTFCKRTKYFRGVNPWLSLFKNLFFNSIQLLTIQKTLKRQTFLFFLPQGCTAVVQPQSPPSFRATPT